MEIICSAVAGMAARLICHPLDTIKTVAFTGFAKEPSADPAAHLTRQPSSFVSSAKAIWRGEGMKGFYRGIGVTTLGAAPGVALYLTSYDYLSRYWLGRQAAYEELPSPTLFQSCVRHTPKEVVYLTCGFGAEAVSCLFWVPIDVTKERLQSQPPSLKNRYRNSLDALRVIHRHEGVLGLYKGYLSTLGSFGPFSAIYFVTYEFLQKRLRQLSDGSDASESTSTSFLYATLSGGAANTFASLCTNPLELVKTRLQVQRAVLGDHKASAVSSKLFHYHYTGLVDGLVHIAKEEGVRGLWRGVWCRAAFTAPNAALTMSFYEVLKSKYAKTA
ncbi:mitochondrial carrier protein [Angomonas deanei]|uniref:Mitochondrial carrier protein, putative n=1 Tax=Angomonas deanei TaxID=59799 RepID=A0A7G2CD47_9TRYP|nr:mitochondrial carrier protein [Angomonas deanei]CAD2216633.1 Mitochondrial carrier protein, putative [Angomonas deanei]|eukprot:EPY33388.1 mitochondrial carrier protein [Angomonas deanei]